MPSDFNAEVRTPDLITHPQWSPFPFTCCILVAYQNPLPSFWYFSFSIFRFLLPSAQCPSNPLLPIFSKFRLLCSSIHAHRFIASPYSNSVIFKQQIPLPSRIHSSIGQSIAPCFHNPPMFASPTKSTIYVKYAFVRISPSVAFLFFYLTNYGNFTYVFITRISC
jgi:hypothetical protein